MLIILGSSRVVSRELTKEVRGRASSKRDNEKRHLEERKGDFKRHTSEANTSTDPYSVNGQVSNNTIPMSESNYIYLETCLKTEEDSDEEMECKQEPKEDEMSLFIRKVESCKEMPYCEIDNIEKKEDMKVTLKDKGEICTLSSVTNHTKADYVDKTFSHENKKICLDSFSEILPHNHDNIEATQKSKKQNKKQKHKRKNRKDKRNNKTAICKVKIRKDHKNRFKLIFSTNSIHLHTENENVILENTFNCHICFAAQKNRSQLYTHYARFHYKEQLHKIIGESKTCPVCKIDQKSTYDLISHLGSVHSYVNNFLPKSYQLALQNQKNIHARKRPKIPELKVSIKKNKIYQNKAKTTEDIINLRKEPILNCQHCETIGSTCICHIHTQKVLSKRQNKSMEKQQNAKRNVEKKTNFDLKCKICVKPTSFVTKSHLYDHYSKVHLKKELKNIIGKSNACPDCEIDGKTIKDLVRHVGSVHRYVEQFLPISYHIPCSKKGKSVKKK